MNRTALLTITFLSSLATPFVVQAMTRANAQPAQVSVTAPAPIVKAVAVEAAATSCARKVKVVYAGYGEGTARPCEAQAVAN
ncbi:MAG TPA: hypothetical protein VKA80_09430 [Beijerinckiaceae bacterium]|nr:hypothetical protein [Beijerinckiaceae bacterium]